MNVVFAVGCKRYRDPRVAQLRYADRDAKRFVETILSTQDPDNTDDYLLHDEHENEDFRPTRSNILGFLSLGKDQDRSIELDFLFFYFSGHGWSSQDGTDYLLTFDSRVNMLEDTAISVPMLERHLKDWEARHVVLFIDACRAVRAGGKGGITIEQESRIDIDSLCPPGMVTFCSCEPGHISYEADSIRSGVFTEGVCKALSDEGRCSTIQELDEYLNAKVPRISRAYGLPSQRPYSRVEPLGVQKALLVSRRIKEVWQTQEHEVAVQSSPETATQEEPLGKYREFVSWVWTGEQLSKQDVQWLSYQTDRLNLSQDDAAAIEHDVMGETKEEILERQERAAEEEAARRRYRDAIVEAWTDKKLSKEEAQRLEDLASELGLSSEATAEIEHQVTGNTVHAIVQRQSREEERQRHLDKLYDRAHQSHRDHRWQEVIDLFAQLHSEDPAYPDSERLLASAREALVAVRQENARRQYREAIEQAWADRELHRHEVEMLREVANSLNVSQSDASALEREVIGETKETILERKDQLDELYARARRLHQAQEWQAVVDTFDQIHAEDPAYPDPEGLLRAARESAPPMVRIPDLNGQKLYESTGTLAKKGLKLRVNKEVSSDAVPEGKIIEQIPEAGAEAEVGSSVSVTVSSGRPTVEVPDLIGQTEPEARRTLYAAGLQLGSVTFLSDTMIREYRRGKWTYSLRDTSGDRVVAQDPVRGKRVQRGHLVSITVDSK